MLLLSFHSSEHLCTVTGHVLRQFFLSALLTLRQQQFQLIRSFQPFNLSLINLTKTMPPLRPLPDLVLITVFKMLTPNDQLVASLTSPRCAVLVRAANRAVKSLVITDQYDVDEVKKDINYYSLASKPAMQQLMDTPGEPSFPDYPMAYGRLSKWHRLIFGYIPEDKIDTATAEQIVNIFSAVTDLKLISNFSQTLEPLLCHPKWQCQLTNLMVRMLYRLDGQQTRELITDINGLTALQQLALDWDNYDDIADLTILAQLKVVAFNANHVDGFLHSLEQYATDNADLQVHLFYGDSDDLLTLSQPLCSRIVRFEKNFNYLQYNRDQVSLLCSQFRSITSLSIKLIQFTEVVQLFTALSPLHQLVHLNLDVGLQSDEEKLPPAPRLPLPPRPLAQMNSLWALELDLSISSHSEIEWMNLSWTMPNLQAIYIDYFMCSSCGVYFNRRDHSKDSLLNSSEALNCFQSSFFALHCGVPLNRLILHSPKECTSAEKLLFQSASEPPVTTGQL